MSKQQPVQSHVTENRPAGGHGTVRSYIVGFVLSLMFTVIPYDLVVNGHAAGNRLLALILSIAVLQMIIQVVFFLHLGREGKPRWQLYFFLGTVFGILTVVVGSIFIMAHLHHNMTPAEASKNLAEDEGIYQIGGARTGACQGQHERHEVHIRQGVVSPLVTEAHYCDSLIFLNEDRDVRDIMFGVSPQQQTYAGQSELILHRGRGESIIVNQAGVYQFYDAQHPEVTGSFMVTRD